jgi:HD-GYP domain-containing protein (c-di-GMP phosphodiesterase class II)
MALGASLGMDVMSVKSLGIAGELHDIGKTMISKQILNKPGKLSSDEFNEVKRHSELGNKIIREMDGLEPLIAQIVLGHHLRFNRCGYPEWAQKLPFNQMIDIIAIADTYDAITTLRVYQQPINPRSALNEMQKLAGTFLDGSLVARFIEMMGKYPVGTLVRLDTNEVAVIYRPNPLDEEAPMVKIMIESDGTRPGIPREQMLIEQDGARYAEIVAVVDPLLKNIDLSKFVLSGNF